MRYADTKELTFLGVHAWDEAIKFAAKTLEYSIESQSAFHADNPACPTSRIVTITVYQPHHRSTVHVTYKYS